MTKTHRKTTTSSDEAFHRHYAAIWGEERWHNSLYPALLRPTRYACLINRYARLEEGEASLLTSQDNLKPLSLPRAGLDRDLNDGEHAIDCFVRHHRAIDEIGEETPSEAPFPPPQQSANGLQSHWNLDAASVLAASLLNVQPGEIVLDLCAAPGGKSITLSQCLWPHLHHRRPQAELNDKDKSTPRSGQLHANEDDAVRQRRLAENLSAYLPRSLFVSKQINVLRVDGSKPSAEYELRVKTGTGTVGYDKVLIDAPCSSERHIIHTSAKNPAKSKTTSDMANWRPGSSKRLAKTQLDLLMTGLKVAAPNATIVYATCSIEPTENDGVVEKAIAQVAKERKKGSKWNIRLGSDTSVRDQDLDVELERNWAEKTKHGWIVLPDHPSGHGWGPLFFAIFTKTDE